MDPSRLNVNSTVPQYAIGCLLHQFSRGIWDKVSCLNTTYKKANGFQSHQRVMVKFYGTLPVAKSEQ